MRISDWSSDVCSADLLFLGRVAAEEIAVGDIGAIGARIRQIGAAERIRALSVTGIGAKAQAIAEIMVEHQAVGIAVRAPEVIVRLAEEVAPIEVRADRVAAAAGNALHIQMVEDE